MVDLEQLQKDLDNGVIVSRATWLELVRYAKQMERAHNHLIRAIAEMDPALQQHDGMRYHRCQFCGDEAGQVFRNNKWMHGPMAHKPGCVHVYAKQMLERAK